MLTILAAILLVPVTFLVLTLAPAIGLQLVLSRCNPMLKTSKNHTPEADVTPLSQRWVRLSGAQGC